MIRRIAATIAAVAMLLVLAVPVMAGGWAEIVADAQTSKPPVEGTPTVIGFRVMQHGVTPAPWETATVHFTDVSTGDKLDVIAKNDDEQSAHFSATATLPHAGYWSWQVTLASLESQQTPVTIAVRTADGKLPAVDPASMMAAIDRVKAEVRSDLQNQFGPTVDDLTMKADQMRARIASLESKANTLREEKNELATRLAAVENGGGGLPLLAVISIAILAGAVAGFAMAWLAGRPASGTKVGTLSPAPRGADPA